VRRAVAQDLERTRAPACHRRHLLTIRLDEVIRQVDELPLLSGPSAARPARPAPAEAAASAAGGFGRCRRTGLGRLEWGQRWADFAGHIWQEVRSLVRVTRIDKPEAMLVAPEQAFFLRENLKLRLLNARLALLSRQFDIAQSDLRDAQSALERYFDRSSARGAGQRRCARSGHQPGAPGVTVPRPDATLAAIAAAAGPLSAHAATSGRPCAASSGSCCCAWWPWWPPPRWAATTAWSPSTGPAGAPTCR
jgi:uroporphyrin-3 C-methyltransferase